MLNVEFLCFFSDPVSRIQINIPLEIKNRIVSYTGKQLRNHLQTTNTMLQKKSPAKARDDIHMRKHRVSIIDHPVQHDFVHRVIDYGVAVAVVVGHSFQSDK